MRVLKTLGLSLWLRISKKTKLSADVYLKGWRHVKIGPECKIHTGVTIDAGRGGQVVLGAQVTLNRFAILNGGRGGIALGDQVEINNQTILDGTGGIVIGPRTLIGPGVRLISYQHRFAGRRPIRGQASDAKPIRIGQDVWIGANAVILAGVSIGEGAVIGAGAVVSRDVPAWGVAVGVPARVVKYRPEEHGES